MAKCNLVLRVHSDPLLTGKPGNEDGPSDQSLDQQSGRSVFNVFLDHQLDLFLIIPSSNPLPFL